jgi:HD superfamily phosphohydrolase YqeK
VEVALGLRLFQGGRHAATLATVYRHSRAVAHLSAMVAPFMGVDPEPAFLCGMVHDVGIAAGLQAVDALVEDPPRIEDIWPAVERVHPAAGRRLAEAWGLGGELAVVVELHHDPRLGPAVSAYAATVCLADHLATRMGCPVVVDASEGNRPIGDVTDATVVREVAARSGLGPDEMSEILRQSESIVALIT